MSDVGSMDKKNRVIERTYIQQQSLIITLFFPGCCKIKIVIIIGDLNIIKIKLF